MQKSATNHGPPAFGNISPQETDPYFAKFLELFHIAPHGWQRLQLNARKRLAGSESVLAHEVTMLRANAQIIGFPWASADSDPPLHERLLRLEQTCNATTEFKGRCIGSDMIFENGDEPRDKSRLLMHPASPHVMIFPIAN